MTPAAGDRERGQLLYATRVAFAISIGGFLMGFDASVISGALRGIELSFGLGQIALGWTVSSLSLAAAVSMLLAGPLSDRIGRRPVLQIAAICCVVSALASAIATSLAALVIARMLGGLGVGAALVIAPMLIAECSPGEFRGRLVSVNQLNIVLGISAAFFSNLMILRLGQSDAAWSAALGLNAHAWRWMLAMEAVPALVFIAALRTVPESPRWLALRGREDEALRVLSRVLEPSRARAELTAVLSGAQGRPERTGTLRELLSPSLHAVMLIGLVIGVLQQITGINAVFFYAPMIFEQSGIGTDAAFVQAVLVGLVNVGFTLLAIALIDRVGRRPLLAAGVAGITICMLLLAWAFAQASYSLDRAAIEALPGSVDRAALEGLLGQVFPDDTAYKSALAAALGEAQARAFEPALIAAAISAQRWVVLGSILGFVACFAVSLGPVMWVLFSELFPNRIRGLAVSVVGLVNSMVSFLVQLLFPWELANLGSALTFLLYGAFGALGLAFVLARVPETRGSSLEELETRLVVNAERKSP